MLICQEKEVLTRVMSLPQPLPAVQPAPKDSPRLCSSWGLGEGVCPLAPHPQAPPGQREGGGEDPHGGKSSFEFQNVWETCKLPLLCWVPLYLPFPQVLLSSERK